MSVGAGIAAGALGTVALNVTTYLDMVVRGRPASEVPEQAVRRLGEMVGIEPAEGDGGDTDGPPTGAVRNRREAMGHLMGYVTGIGTGAVYGLVRRRLDAPPLPVAAAGIAIGAMAGANLPAILLGVTNPKEWTVSGWLSDLVPHLAFGLFTALGYEGFRRR